MAFATVRSCTLAGVNAVPVNVEVHTAGGLPCINLVGLPQSAVRESKDRVRAAIQNSGFEFPAVRVTINLAPADLPKQGGRFDLPIALGIMLARGYLPERCLDNYCVVGELGLNGNLRAVRGALPSALALRDSVTTLLCPHQNVVEASRSKRTQVIGAGSLTDVVSGLLGQSCTEKMSDGDGVVIPNAELWTSRPPKESGKFSNEKTSVVKGSPSQQNLTLTPSTYKQHDFSDVKGHVIARRVMEIAAAGGHNVLLTGSPGTGKSMLAARMAGILPPMTEQEALETASVSSLCFGENELTNFGDRPFRAPHHTVSAAALIGGGHKAMPGEISLAHNGVLFLDEMAEFPRSVLDAMREPLEVGYVHISRMALKATYPAKFQLVGSTNPCPCGYFGDSTKLCNCSESQLQNYQAKLSGPLLDRIDLQVTVERASTSEIFDSSAGEPSESIRQRVLAARKIQLTRQKTANQFLAADNLSLHCQLDGECTDDLRLATERMSLSHRAVHRCLRVARTIADLEGAEPVKKHHLIEALSYRLQTGS